MNTMSIKLSVCHFGLAALKDSAPYEKSKEEVHFSAVILPDMLKSCKDCFGLTSKVAPTHHTQTLTSQCTKL